MRKTKIRKTDYNIEYAHIYADERFGIEQERSIKKLKKIINQLKQKNKSYVLAVLVDEYNAVRYILNIKNYLEKLKKLDAEPDFIGFESRLAPCKNLILREMKGKIKKNYQNYIKKHKKLPCSLLVAVWHLKRLGLIETKRGDLNCLNKKKSFIARNIITILPEKYRKVEERALEIIKSTKFKRYSDNIINIFFN